MELSGIGRKDVLDNARTERKIDLSGVGENLQDHLRIQATHELQSNITGLDILRYNQTRAAIGLDLWRQGQTSLYQYSGNCYGSLKWQTAAGNNSRLLQLATSVADLTNLIDRMKLSLLTDPTSRTPDLQVVCGDSYISTRSYPSNTTSGYGKKYATLLAIVMHSFARGSVHISSANAPIIDPNYIGNAFDLEATKQAAKYLRKMSTTSPFKELRVKEYDPGFETQTDEQWEAYVRENVSTFYHQLGTCAMLPREDGGVVDPELRVYGARNLRVVDASVIPIMISANIQMAVYGIAERAAEIIAGEYR